MATRSNFNSNVSGEFPDQNNGQITPVNLRDLANNVSFPEDFTSGSSPTSGAVSLDKTGTAPTTLTLNISPNIVMTDGSGNLTAKEINLTSSNGHTSVKLAANENDFGNSDVSAPVVIKYNDGTWTSGNEPFVAIGDLANSYATLLVSLKDNGETTNGTEVQAQLCYAADGIYNIGNGAIAGYFNDNGGGYTTPNACQICDGNNALVALGPSVFYGVIQQWSSDNTTQEMNILDGDIQAQSFSLNNNSLVINTDGNLTTSGLIAANGLNVTKINNVPGAGQVIPTIIYSNLWADQTASITTTNISASQSGVLRVNYYFHIKATQTASGTVQATFSWSDVGAARSKTSATLSLNSQGYDSGSFPVYVNNGSLSFSTTISSRTNATYDLFLRIEQM